MIRINLLPPEITEKRRAEQRWKYVVWAALALYLVIGVFWSVMYLQVQAKSADVAGKQQQAQALQTQANTFKVFEDRQQDLKARQSVADKALASRVAWSKLFSELALVLPSDAWLKELKVDEKKFEITGQAVDARGDQASSGFKPVAKLLVHMADVAQLENVWLSNSSQDTYAEQPIMKFDIVADIATPTVTPGGAPAPPNQP